MFKTQTFSWQPLNTFSLRLFLFIKFCLSFSVSLLYLLYFFFSSVSWNIPSCFCLCWTISQFQWYLNTQTYTYSVLGNNDTNNIILPIFDFEDIAFHSCVRLLYVKFLMNLYPLSIIFFLPILLLSPLKFVYLFLHFNVSIRKYLFPFYLCLILL